MQDRRNTVELQVESSFGLFTNPMSKTSGEKFTYPVPTYEALRGIMRRIYKKPTFTWYIDAVRIMNPIVMEPMPVTNLSYNTNARDRSFHTYLVDCKYQIRAHFEWNLNQTNMERDRIYQKHLEIANRRIKNSPAYPPFLGVSECPALVTPCKFGEGKGAYDGVNLDFGLMFHGFIYPDEALSPDKTNQLVKQLWNAKMENGIINFPHPSDSSLWSEVIDDDCPMTLFPDIEKEGNH